MVRRLRRLGFTIPRQKETSFMSLFCSQRTKTFPRYHLCSPMYTACKIQSHPDTHLTLSSEATFRKRCLSGLSATALTLCKVLSFPTPLHRHSMKFITLIFYRVFAEKSRVSGNSAERNYELYVPLVPYSRYSMVHSLSYHRNPRRPIVIHRFTGFPPAAVSSTTLRLGSKS